MAVVITGTGIGPFSITGTGPTDAVTSATIYAYVIAANPSNATRIGTTVFSYAWACKFNLASCLWNPVQEAHIFVQTPTIGASAEFRNGSLVSGIAKNGGMIQMPTSGSLLTGGGKFSSYGGLVAATLSTPGTSSGAVVMRDTVCQWADSIANTGTSDYFRVTVGSSGAVGFKVTVIPSRFQDVKFAGSVIAFQQSTASPFTPIDTIVEGVTYDVVDNTAVCTLTFQGLYSDFGVPKNTLAITGERAGGIKIIQWRYNLAVSSASGLLSGAAVTIRDALGFVNYAGATASGVIPQQTLERVRYMGLVNRAYLTPWGGVITDKYPHIVRVRTFGFLPVEIVKQADQHSADGVVLAADTGTTGTATAAAAIMGVSINPVTETVTVSAALMAPEIYNAIAYYLALVANHGVPWFASCSGITVRTDAWNWVINAPVTGAIASSAGVITALAARVSAVVLTGAARWDTQAPCVAQGGSADAYTVDGVLVRTMVRITAATADAVADFRAFEFAPGAAFENASGQPIMLRLAPGQQAPALLETAGAITIDVTTAVTTTIPGLALGMEVFVFATGTQDVIASTINCADSFAWTQAITTPVTVDYTVMKDGYLPVRVTGVTVSATATLPAPALVTDRAFKAPNGLAFGSTAKVNLATNRFAVTEATTVQNWYSFMVQSWRTQASLKNKPFPLSTNGPNSFSLEGWEFSAGLDLLKRDGLRYTSGGAVTASWLALYSVDTAEGMQVRYQQADGTGTAAAATTGKIDQLIQVYGDAAHGDFDRSGHLVCKVQRDGYDQAEANVVATYGALEDQFYVIGLNPTPNGLPTGEPAVNGEPTIVDHGDSPVTWHGSAYSITITDSAGGNSGQTLMRWIRYNLAIGGNFQGRDTFDWHDLVQTNGSAFKTVRGTIYGDSGAAIKGVRVVTAEGADHPDFSLHTADDGSTYVPVFPVAARCTVLSNSRARLVNLTTGVEVDNAFVTGSAYSKTITTQASPGDTLQLWVCKKGFEEAEAYAVWSAGGATFRIEQVPSAPYAAWATDGEEVREFALDGPHLVIDANDVDGRTQKTRLAAFYSYALTTEIGIRYFFKAMTFLSAAEIRINVERIDFKVKNINPNHTLVFTDSAVRLFCSDGSTFIADDSYSMHNDYTGVPSVIGGIPSPAQNAAAVRTELTTELTAMAKESTAQAILGLSV